MIREVWVACDVCTGTSAVHLTTETMPETVLPPGWIQVEGRPVTQDGTIRLIRWTLCPLCWPEKAWAREWESLLALTPASRSTPAEMPS
jgi:hypothetical protein